LPNLNHFRILLTFSCKFPVSNLMEIHPVGAPLMHVGRSTGLLADMTEVMCGSLWRIKKNANRSIKAKVFWAVTPCTVTQCDWHVVRVWCTASVFMRAACLLLLRDMALHTEHWMPWTVFWARWIYLPSSHAFHLDSSFMFAVNVQKWTFLLCRCDTKAFMTVTVHHVEDHDVPSDSLQMPLCTQLSKFLTFIF
jgi:hypothetical protein